MDEAIAAAYADAEGWLLRLVAEAVASGATGTAEVYQARLDALQVLMQESGKRLNALEEGLPERVADAITEAYQEGTLQATVGMDRPSPPSMPDAALSALAVEATTALASQRLMVLRSVEDGYREVVKLVTERAVSSGMDINRAMQEGLDQFANRGITAFVDKRGRRYTMDVYTRMALRTARNNATNQGRIDGFRANDINLIQTSWHRAAAPMCIPYQGRILSLDGQAGPRTVWSYIDDAEVTIDVTATIEEALEHGYHHPNAILGGDQLIDTWGKTQAGSQGTYAGPAVTIRTAKGNSLTVSPEHPVLTSAGWRTAESVGVGDNLFRTAKSGPMPVSVVGSADLEHVETTVEEEFCSLKSGFVEVTTPAAGHDFNDDRQFLQGEVHVVVPETGLLPVPDVQIVKGTGEVHFSVEGFPNVRPGDSNDTNMVRTAIPGAVELDEVVAVDFHWFNGHAYDFQTEDGVYAVGGLIAHNCAHIDTAYIPGTDIPDYPDVPEEEHEEKQRQRAIERNIRHWKRREAVAITPAAQQQAKAKVRAWQAAQRAHVKKFPYLRRNYARERLWTGNAGNATARILPTPTTPLLSPSTFEQHEIRDGFRPSVGGTDRGYTLRGLRRTQRRDWAQVATDANPGYRVDRSAYGVNCARVANAAELRRRGYDVSAGPGMYSVDSSVGGEKMRDYLVGLLDVRTGGTYKGASNFVSTTDVAMNAWRTADGATRVPQSAMKAAAKGGRNAATVEMFERGVPEGATGFAEGKWKGRKDSSHIWNWTKQDGKIKFFEAQNGSGFRPRSEYLDRLSDATLRMVRVDDLTPTDDILKVIDHEDGRRF